MPSGVSRPQPVPARQEVLNTLSRGQGPEGPEGKGRSGRRPLRIRSLCLTTRTAEAWGALCAVVGTRARVSGLRGAGWGGNLGAWGAVARAGGGLVAT